MVELAFTLTDQPDAQDLERIGETSPSSTKATLVHPVVDQSPR